MNIESSRVFRLLIVDDNEAIHEDLRKILIPSQDTSALEEDEGMLFGITRNADVAFDLESAFQGQQGLERVEAALASQRPYALAFVDIRMPPGWDGIETIERIWKVDPEIQVVICTAYSDYNWRDIERRIGLTHNLVILKKPFDPIEVTQLAHALTAKWQGSKQIRVQIEELDRLVDQRTSELLSTVRQLEEAKQLAEEMALEDSLTGLPNRRLFMRRLAIALENSRTHAPYLCAVLYLDVDRFKFVNDSLGHVVGDELLTEIATRLKSCLREGSGRTCSEDLIARLGGDEFAILLDGVRDRNGITRVAQRLCDSLLMPFRVHDKELTSTASIGIVVSDGKVLDADTMMRNADAAMYRAKEAGGGICVLFDENIHRSNLDRLQKEVEMRQALERREFFLCYQPVISLNTGMMDSAEALIRWQSPTRGLINPVDFIPLSEETGLIVPIGAWTLKESCLQLVRWYQRFGSENVPIVSVNLSARQFSQPDLLKTIQNAILDSGANARSLRLELTETATMRDPERAASMLSQLQKIGVQLSIDDFGTGYSSLNYLHQFSIDTLKIDKSFVSNMEKDERSLSIVRTIINLAHNLKMKVVAEGVETREQVRMLSNMHCDSAQGFYFSRPLRSDAIEALMQQSAVFALAGS